VAGVPARVIGRRVLGKGIVPVSLSDFADKDVETVKNGIRDRYDDEVSDEYARDFVAFVTELTHDDA
jgi:hypothetical protein